MRLIAPKPISTGFADDILRIAIAQVSPVWLDRDRTLSKIKRVAANAADEGAQLVVFGEALAPGYPFWLENTGGAKFDDPKQKAFFARYLKEGVVIERGDLEPLCTFARNRSIAIYLGVMERAPDRGGHSLYCSLVYITENGVIASVHRKLHPTYQERLVWAQGDGHGLQVHDIGPFRVGGLNCWENWLPMARTALYAQGENLHVSVWPGGSGDTIDSPRFIALESRSYVIAACGLLREEDIPADIPDRDKIIDTETNVTSNGGSALVAPDGTFIVEPVIGVEALILADIDHRLVREERLALDVSGHYARPDVLQLSVNRKRQTIVEFEN